MTNAFDFFRLFFPISLEKSQVLKQAAKLVTPKQLKDLKYLMKLGRVTVKTIKHPVSELLISGYQYPMLVSHIQDPQISKFIQQVNTKLEKDSKKEIFSKYDPDKLLKLIAPHVIGFADIKKAAMLQLFAKDKFHILMLGDPGTGKTEILRSVQDLAPISSFGLGSGTSGVGLTVTVSGKEISKGLLPMADLGICCIDELNLIKKEDLGSIYNAMEKGFVTYDKKGKHLKFPARVRILATANPRGDTFGNDVSNAKEQLPFDQALLTRFHLIFFIRRPDKEQFMRITKKMLKHDYKEVSEEDLQFVHDYIQIAESIVPKLDKKIQEEIISFIDTLKKDEKQFFLTISPRIVVGIMNLCKARARMFLRDQVTHADVEEVLGIFRNSLYETY